MYKDFIKRICQNYNSTTGKLSACIVCWAFIPSQLKKRHLEHEPYIVTASFFKNEEAFIKLAKDNGKLTTCDRGDRVILFNEKCAFNYGPEAIIGPDCDE